MLFWHPVITVLLFLLVVFSGCSYVYTEKSLPSPPVPANIQPCFEVAEWNRIWFTSQGYEVTLCEGQIPQGFHAWILVKIKGREVAYEGAVPKYEPYYYQSERLTLERWLFIVETSRDSVRINGSWISDNAIEEIR